MLRLRTLHFVVGLLCGVGESRGLLEAMTRISSMPTYLPVKYQILNAESAFFLKEANQDIMRNSTLQSRSESFFIYQARQMPSVNASYGSVSVEQSVPLDLLQSPSSFVPSSMFTFNWKVQTYIISDKVYYSWPKVQVLFYIAGRDWDDYSTINKLPCVKMFAFRETQEVRGTCRLKGDLGLCVAELEPLSSWFDPPSVVPGRQKGLDQSEGAAVELYYVIQSSEKGDCSSEDSRKGNSIRSEQDDMFDGSTTSPMQRIGSVRLYQAPSSPQMTELRLDSNVMIKVPSKPVKQSDIVMARVFVASASKVEMFTLRVKLRKGVNFLGARSVAPRLWAVRQETGNDGRRTTIVVFCQKKAVALDYRADASLTEIVQMDFEVDAFADFLGTKSIQWQAEYPSTGTLSEEAETEIHVVQKDLGSIVPLAMDTEILNTAVLTGKTVAVPVKVVNVGQSGAVTDVSDFVECQSTDEDVVKVSDRCDYIFVNGKEMKGKLKIAVNFTYEYLNAQLEMTVWIPRLPLQIEVSDAELNQIKGWRVPITSSKRSARDSDDDDDDDRRARGCTLQYQHAMVRVLTHFVAEPLGPGGQLVYMLGTDWQFDITDLVMDFLKVEDPHIVKLEQGRVLVGLDPGMTTIQVLSPLSDSILAEKTVTVLEDKVSVTDVAVQLVTSLSLSLQLSTGSNRAVVATATTQELLHSAKQEALLSAWIHFSDGSATPLNVYNPDYFTVAAVSVDEDVVSVQQDATHKWPVVVAEGEGQGPLVKMELVICEACQKSKRKSILASGSGNVRVKFGQNDASPKGAASDYGVDGEDLDNHASDRRHKPVEQDRTGLDVHYYGSSISDLEDGILRRISTTVKSAITRKSEGDKLADEGNQLHRIPIDFSNFPAQVDLPRNNRDMEDNDPLHARGLSDLEIGMYALLGVFCLAILVFLINCVSYALKYRHKQLPLEGQETLNHSHDWVWLGNEAELLENHMGALGGQQEEHTTIIDGEEGSHLLNGGSTSKNVQSQVHRSADSGVSLNGKEPKSEPLHSPTSKRKRVKFTTFTTIPSDDGCPSVKPLGLGSHDDIKWVCQDMELGDPRDLRHYMERLGDSSLHEAP
ncbi:transmembrane protein 132C isoform X1 [Polypterus senegalus]|uniref:transmembrane protein 132C isoform X1 n=2 Tax=Polypterus senegalus TaxID=55291 RepID=UPI00196683FF|nr:transmembrane protein 132C isoform X1 [Polypterus senegalus]